ncbi:MAG: GNAT family N-acetyltransferase [Rhodobacteraceae bacterium]|nr:GNAT family N-acetyltransferase [Paracoccaceae bacterium]
MTVRFRKATRADIPAILALLRDDVLGAARENRPPGDYLAAFDRMQQEAANWVILGQEDDGSIVATYQLTFVSGLSLGATRRAQIESVRVSGTRRGQRIGEAMIADAEARARDAGCTLLQLTMNAARDDARRFYERAGFTASHIGFKRDLT